MTSISFRSFRITDYICMGVILAVLMVFAVSDQVFGTYSAITKAHPLFAGFCKFAVLATFGECVAARLRTGHYWSPTFGIIAKAAIWGVFGVIITICFSIFSTGVVATLSGLGMKSASTAMSGGFGFSKILVALCISASLNLLFAPLLMIGHKLTDLHIAAHQGNVNCLWAAPNMPALFRAIDWNIMWSFVLAKTVPLFWIPAHTITFLLPDTFRVLFAAVLGAVLGIILALKK